MPQALPTNPFAEITQRLSQRATSTLALGEELGRIAKLHQAAWTARRPAAPTLPAMSANPMEAAKAWGEYLVDASQRSVLFLDVLRRRGNTFIAHEEAGCPPVLVFDYETIVDGRALKRPVNYALVRITPPAGVIVDDTKRPFVIIDPRAGHGSGIGGFKSDSQVGVALKAGHPVYFVIFHRDPEPGQSIPDVTAAETEFLHAVADRHPAAPKPVVIGNCQGGWAVMMLAAAQPDLVGPIVMNGAPLSYWAGENGRNPMRYLGGLAGGIWPALMLADLGNGRFDGANLVENFEKLNPGATKWAKYYDLFSKVDTEAERFLEFEKWWGGFFLMNEEEIAWIVQNLFIGNRLESGGVKAGGKSLDLKAIRRPIIVFASAGDNITPPQQALNWIADEYSDVGEIRARGQVIVYMLHESIGHLGIFVSASVAKKEHTEITSTLGSVEALSPGLYEMLITDKTGEGPNARYHVTFAEREIADIRAIDSDGSEAEAFTEVARISDAMATMYATTLRPMIRMFRTEAQAEAMRQRHPLRRQRSMFADRNPMMKSVAPMAEAVRASRKPADAANPFLAWERLWADSIRNSMDSMRDMRDAMQELSFHAIYGTLASLRTPGETMPEVLAPSPALLRDDPEVARALGTITTGGYAEAVIRMLILLARGRGAVRRSRLQRSQAMLSSVAPFAALGVDGRARIIREQGIIVALEPEKAIDTLPGLLVGHDARARAIAAVEEIAGPAEEMAPATIAMLDRLRTLLDVPRIAGLIRSAAE